MMMSADKVGGRVKKGQNHDDVIFEWSLSKGGYVSQNQLHCKANLNFCLMSKKAKHCWALSTNFSFLFS